MMNVTPARRIVLCLALVIGVATAASPLSSARGDTRVPAHVWGVEVDASALPKLTPTFMRVMRSSGINVLFARRDRFSRPQNTRLAALARRWHMLLVEPVPPPATPVAAAALKSGCKGAGRLPSTCA